MLPAKILAFLDALCRWAHSQPDLAAIILVGSYARGAASEDSDVDLVILTPDVDRYLRERSWASSFGEATGWRQENYGRLTSVRVFYDGGLEVEYGFSTPDWAESPIDAGTLSVVMDGMEVLYDPQGIVAALQREIEPLGE
jgi:hypothetical protein